MLARILCTSVPRDAARVTAQLCTQLGYLNGHCLYNSSASTCLDCSKAAVHSHGTGLAVHTHAAPSITAPHNSNQPWSRAAGNVSSSTISSWAGSAGVIFRHAMFTAPPCMWAAQTPQQEDAPAHDAEARKITSKLNSCRNLAALSDFYSEWGGRFNAMNTATAIKMYATLRRRREADTQLLPKLLHCWLQQLPDAGEQACGNVLWALGKLGTGLNEVWEPTFAAYLRHVQNTPAQSINPQGISKVLWAVGNLCRLQGWQAGVTEDAIQQLLGEQQLQVLSASGTTQNISNVLLGLTHMSTAAAPVVSKAFAQRCSRQLLADTVQCLITSGPQHVSNTMYACGELGLADAAFLEAAADRAANWVPNSLDMAVRQAATACAKLQFRHQGLMTALLQRGQQLLQPSGVQGRQQRPLHSRGLGQADKEKVVARLCSAVAHLDMQQLAPQALQLVSISGIVNRPDIHKAALQRLWVFHSWLLQHQLAGGQGLTGLLTQQQLKQGQQEVALFPDLI